MSSREINHCVLLANSVFTWALPGCDTVSWGHNLFLNFLFTPKPDQFSSSTATLLVTTVEKPQQQTHVGTDTGKTSQFTQPGNKILSYGLMSFTQVTYYVDYS